MLDVNSEIEDITNDICVSKLNLMGLYDLISNKNIKRQLNDFSVKFSTFYKHYKAGEKTELIVAKYSNKVKYTDYQGNEYHNLSEMLKVYNIPLKTYYSRKRLKWDLKRILTTKVKQFEYDGIMYHSLFDFCKRNKMSEKLIPLLREILK